MPCLLRTGKIPLSSPVAFCVMPNALGMEGPVMSASRMAVRRPFLFIATASSDVVSDLPTPALSA